jgi:hypothetical protein
MANSLVRRLALYWTQNLDLRNLETRAPVS